METIVRKLMKIIYSQIKEKILKLNTFYVINQGDYMNKYKNFEPQNKKFEDFIDLQEKEQALTIKLREFFVSDALYKFSNFEIQEISRIKSILNNLVNPSDNTNDSIYLNDLDLIGDFLKFAFDKETFDSYVAKRNAIFQENKKLNFELKALMLQKKKMIDNFDLKSAIKISEKVNDVVCKIKTQRESVGELKSSIKSSEIDFYQNYLDFLNNISKNTIIKSKIENPDVTHKNVLDYFKINKFIFFIQSSIKDVQMEEVIKVLKADKFFESKMGDVLDDLMYGLMYVGTNL